MRGTKQSTDRLLCLVKHASQKRGLKIFRVTESLLYRVLMICAMTHLEEIYETRLALKMESPRSLE